MLVEKNFGILHPQYSLQSDFAIPLDLEDEKYINGKYVAQAMFPGTNVPRRRTVAAITKKNHDKNERTGKYPVSYFEKYSGLMRDDKGKIVFKNFDIKTPAVIPYEKEMSKTMM